jgi:hypothetical protein
MVALVVVLLAVVALLCVVVTGLLRSHADILRSLHQLGAGVGDPLVGPQPVGMPTASRAGTAGAPSRAAPLGLPNERSSVSVHDIEGTTVGGDSVVVSVSAAPLTLLAFLSSGCTSCATIWAALADEQQLRLLPDGVRVVAVTKGSDFESPEAVSARAPRGVTVVMSTAAFGDYEVPGSPFFALVDGVARRRVGEGVANHFSQIADLVRRAGADQHMASPGMTPAGTSSRASALGLDGAQREEANDAELAAAGITPGHPSLYPRNLQDIFASTAPSGLPDGDAMGPRGGPVGRT